MEGVNDENFEVHNYQDGETISADFDTELGDLMKDQDRIKYVRAQLEEKRTSLNNMEAADSTNYGPMEISKMEGLKADIKKLEGFQDILEQKLDTEPQVQETESENN